MTIRKEDPCRLTKEQLATTNGCGSSYWAAWIFRIPNWISKSFFNCCNFHDIAYQEDKTIKDKYLADDNLYDCMYYSAFHSPWWQKRIKLFVADVVYLCLGTELSISCFLEASKNKLTK